MTVCDVGCGDFHIGNQIAKHTQKYVAVHMVNDLIDRNRTMFKAANLKFVYFIADVVLLRNVLQHLSNAEVQRIVRNLTDHKYAIVTEHIPKGSFTLNKVIISGQGIRLKVDSGIDLLVPPFNLMVKDSKQLFALLFNYDRGVILTMFYRIN